MSVRKKEIQFGISATADFEENTWTFEMPEDYSVSAGEYALVPKDKFDKAIEALSAMKKLAYNGDLDKAELLTAYMDEIIDDLGVGLNF